MKKLYFFLLLIFLNACGYQPIYSSKNFVFKIGQINYEQSRLNKEIVRSLRSISNPEASKTLNLNLESVKEKIVVSKTKTGDPEKFELSISVKIKVLDEEKKFLSKQNYSNIDNKFKLNEYETEIENQLISKIIDDILIYLTKF